MLVSCARFSFAEYIFSIATEVIMINGIITNNVIFDLTDVLFIK